MRKAVLPVLLLGSVMVIGCEDSVMGVDQPGTSTGDPALTVTTGETFSHIGITDPTGGVAELTVGSSTQMHGTLFYSAGGRLNAAPYAQWRSTDECVATVTNASPSWGLVQGVSAGTTRIVAEAWGKTDTVTVTVTGSGHLDPECEVRQWSWDWDDVSFTGSRATSYGVEAGEKLTQVVLFAGPRPDYTLQQGGRVTLRSELWYDQGGKLNGRGFVVFSSLDVSVATINARGVVSGRGPGQTKLIARLGTLADTVPIFVTGVTSVTE